MAGQDLQEAGRRVSIMKKLTKGQAATLKMHSKKHSRKHMALMRRLMIQGKSFGAAHKAAQNKVGK